MTEPVNELLENMGDYAVRVAGLGIVEALFLINAHSDDEARRHMRIGSQSDPRQTVLALYRIVKINADRTAEPTSSNKIYTYLLTGVRKEKGGKKNLVNLFFEDYGDYSAQGCAEQTGLQQARLYRCTSIGV